MFQNSILGTLTWICFIIYTFEYVCLYLCVSDIWLQLGFIRAKTVVSLLPKRHLPVMMKHHIPYPFQARRFPLAGPLNCLLSIAEHPNRPRTDSAQLTRKPLLSGFRTVWRGVLGKLCKGICRSLPGEWAELKTNHFFLVGGRRWSDWEEPIPGLPGARKAPILDLGDGYVGVDFLLSGLCGFDLFFLYAVAIISKTNQAR